MKKILIGVAVAAVFVLVGVVLFKRSGGESRAATLAPVDTVFFVNIPDVPRTGFRWISTALAQIAAEDEMQALLELPLKNLKESPAAKEAFEALASLKPGNIFLAARADGKGLLGFQFWGNRRDFDAAVARLRQHLPEAAQAGEKEIHNGVEILTTKHGDQSLHSAAIGRWGFLSNDAGEIRNAIDRASGNSTTTTLQSKVRFTKVLPQLPVDPELMFFIEPQSALDSLLEAGRSMGASPIPSQVQEIKSAEAIGGTLKFDGRLQRDAIFILRESRVETLPKLNHSAMALTTPATTAFCDFSLNIAAVPDLLKTLADDYPAILTPTLPLAEAAAQLYGPECALTAHWADGKMIPDLLMAVSNRDESRSEDFIAQVVSNIPGTTRRDVDGKPVREIPLGAGSLTIANDKKFLLLGLENEAVAQALKPATQTLRDSPEFKSALPAYESANEAFCYIHSRTVFTRLYDSLLPILRFSAAMMPNLKNQIDLTKLPKAQVIAQHLPPTIFSQKRTLEGTLIESSGPLSISELLILGGYGYLATQNRP